MIVGRKSRIATLVFSRLTADIDFIPSDAWDEKDKRVQKALLEMARRSFQRTRKSRRGKRARHAKKAKLESAVLTKSQKRERRKAAAKKRKKDSQGTSSGGISKKQTA